MYKKIVAGAALVLVSAVVPASANDGVPTRVFDGGILEKSVPVEMNTVRFSDASLNVTKTRKIWFGKQVTTHKKISISVERKGVKPTPTGLLENWVIFRNHTKHDRQIEARTLYFDSSQAPVGADAAWKRVFITSNSTANYRETASSFDAAYYIVEVREAR